MIFVTVGSQLPFDRLVNIIDHWAGENNSQKVFAQIGASESKPENIEFCETMTPDDYNMYFDESDVIIAHAGMGTIISALEYEKPLVILPRLAANGEHRNDHQLATAKHFSGFKNIYIANNESELSAVMNDLINHDLLSVTVDATKVSDKLISAIREFAVD